MDFNNTKQQRYIYFSYCYTKYNERQLSDLSSDKNKHWQTMYTNRRNHHSVFLPDISPVTTPLMLLQRAQGPPKVNHFSPTDFPLYLVSFPSFSHILS